MTDMEEQFLKDITALAAGQSTYQLEAYFWVLRALERARQGLARAGHITGRELLEGHRELGLIEFGPMAYDVFTHWGLRSGKDLGEVVFQLVDAGLLRRDDNDSMDDFDDAYDFHEEFVDKYRW